MNFLEAVQALKDDKCKKIKSKVFNVEYVIKNGIICYNEPTSFGISLHPHNFLGEWEVVDPIPENEEKEIKRYALVNDSGEIYSVYEKENIPGHIIKHAAKHGYKHLIELKGNFKVPKEKIKHRTEVNLSGIKPYPLFSTDKDGKILPKNAKYYAEWEE